MTRRNGLFFCFAGLAIAACALLVDDSLFPNGRWPVILIGALFALAGFQMVRVSMLKQAADGPVSSVIAILIYGIFCSLSWYVAFKKNVVIMTMDPETHQTGGPDPDQLTAHVIAGLFGLLFFLGMLFFIFKLIKQLRIRL